MISHIKYTQVQPQTLKKQPSKNNANQSFKGAFGLGTQALNFLNTSPAIGACFVDFLAMVAPRTLVDFNRSFDAGVETGFRESSGTINHALAGAVGLCAGYLVSSAFNKAHGVKAHQVFMTEEAIDTFANFINKSNINQEYNSKKYWKEFFNSLEYFNTSEGGTPWKSLNKLNNDEKQAENLIKKAVDIITEQETKKYKLPKNTMAQIIEEITGSTGASSTFRIAGTNVEGSIKDLTNNAHSLLRTVQDKYAHDGNKIIENLDEFLKGIKNKKLATIAAGLSVPIAIGMSVQPLNRYLTKKRTGNDGFVGVEGRKPDKTKEFKLLKLATGLGLGSMMIASILKHPTHLYTKFGKAKNEIISKLQYKGTTPTIDQFKFIYGLTIVSRLLACRDKNELRESSIKDSLGFANWLILGSFVSKIVAKLSNKDLLNYDKATQKQHYIFASKEKNHEEIIYKLLKKAGISTTKDGKVRSFNSLIKEIQNLVKENSPHAAEAKKVLTQIKYKNLAQLCGYIYSGVVLGWGIPKLNIFITKKVENKNKNHQKDTGKQIDKMKIASDFVQNITKSENKTFSAFYGSM